MLAHKYISVVHHKLQTEYDYVVVGGGITGLSLAEGIQRSGQRVLLIEREPQVGGGASGDHQNVFHLGFYYGHRLEPAVTTLYLQNLSTLLKNYSGFNGQDLVAHEDGYLAH